MTGVILSNLLQTSASAEQGLKFYSQFIEVLLEAFKSQTTPDELDDIGALISQVPNQFNDVNEDVWVRLGGDEMYTYTEIRSVYNPAGDMPVPLNNMINFNVVRNDGLREKLLNQAMEIAWELDTEDISIFAKELNVKFGVEIPELALQAGEQEGVISFDEFEEEIVNIKLDRGLFLRTSFVTERAFKSELSSAMGSSLVQAVDSVTPDGASPEILWAVVRDVFNLMYDSAPDSHPQLKTNIQLWVRSVVLAVMSDAQWEDARSFSMAESDVSMENTALFVSDLFAVPEFITELYSPSARGKVVVVGEADDAGVDDDIANSGKTPLVVKKSSKTLNSLKNIVDRERGIDALIAISGQKKKIGKSAILKNPKLAKIAQKMSSDPFYLNIINMIGRMKQEILQSVSRKKLEDFFIQDGLTHTGYFEDAEPSEQGLFFADPCMFDYQATRMSNHELFKENIIPDEEPEKVKGPVCVLVDRSGSMGGTKLAVAKALGVATLSVAAEQNRDAVLYFFDDLVQKITWPSDPLMRIEAFDQICGVQERGGTNISLALTESYTNTVSPWQKEAEKDSSKGLMDVLLLSDGQSEVEESSVTDLTAVSRLFYVVIGDLRESNPLLQKHSTHMLLLDPKSTESEMMNQLSDVAATMFNASNTENPTQPTDVEEDVF
jgi:Mg-chelatase subunit ChlD